MAARLYGDSLGGHDPTQVGRVVKQVNDLDVTKLGFDDTLDLIKGPRPLTLVTVSTRRAQSPVEIVEEGPADDTSADNSADTMTARTPGQPTTAEEADGTALPPQAATGPGVTPEPSSGAPDNLVTPESVKAMASYLGIDEMSEPHLMPVAARALTEPLPPGWEERLSPESAEPYYVELATGVTSSEHPSDQHYREFLQEARQTPAPADASSIMEFTDPETLLPYSYDFAATVSTAAVDESPPRLEASGMSRSEQLFPDARSGEGQDLAHERAMDGYNKLQRAAVKEANAGANTAARRRVKTRMKQKGVKVVKFNSRSSKPAEKVLSLSKDYKLVQWGDALHQPSTTLKITKDVKVEYGRVLVPERHRNKHALVTECFERPWRAFNIVDGKRSYDFYCVESTGSTCLAIAAINAARGLSGKSTRPGHLLWRAARMHVRSLALLRYDDDDTVFPQVALRRVLAEALAPAPGLE